MDSNLFFIPAAGKSLSIGRLVMVTSLPGIKGKPFIHNRFEKNGRIGTIFAFNVLV
jgi:hypothetical protein